MDAIEMIRQRRSTMSFLPQALRQEDLRDIIELANLAPSPLASQNRHFVVVTQPQVRAELAIAALNQPHVAAAPAVVIVTSKPDFISPEDMIKRCTAWDMNLWGATPADYKTNRRFLAHYAKWKATWNLIDSSLAAHTLILAAQSRGIGSCWIGMFDEVAVKRLAKLPTEVDVVALVALGYPDGSARERNLKSTDEIIHWEEW